MLSLIWFQKTSIFVLLRSSLMDDDIVHTLAGDPSQHCPGEFYTNNFTKVYYVSYHPGPHGNLGLAAFY